MYQPKKEGSKVGDTQTIRIQLWQTRQCIKKQRHHFTDKGLSMVFPVVMYGCESWTIKLSTRVDAFELWCWRRLLKIPWTAKKSNPEYSLEGLMLKFQYFGHLMQRVDPLEKTLMLGKTKGRRRRGRQRMRWHHQLNGLEFEQILGDGEGQGNLACCSPWGHRARHEWVIEQQKSLIQWL